jgi:hypothetical protein
MAATAAGATGTWVVVVVERRVVGAAATTVSHILLVHLGELLRVVVGSGFKYAYTYAV